MKENHKEKKSLLLSSFQPNDLWTLTQNINGPSLSVNEWMSVHIVSKVRVINDLSIELLEKTTVPLLLTNVGTT